MITKFRFTLFITLAVAFCSTSLTAQSTYDSAIGLRLGSPYSISYKTFLNGSNNAIEVFGSFNTNLISSNYRWGSIGVGGGYLVHNAIESVDGLQWYYGVGASVYFYFYDSDFAGFADQATIGLGVLGFLGLDYKFEDAPINLSLDWVPLFAFNGYGKGFGAGRGALAVRYTLD
jgi:hypothetical protein